MKEQFLKIWRSPPSMDEFGRLQQKGAVTVPRPENTEKSCQRRPETAVTMQGADLWTRCLRAIAFTQMSLGQHHYTLPETSQKCKRLGSTTHLLNQKLLGWGGKNLRFNKFSNVIQMHAQILSKNTAAARTTVKERRRIINTLKCFSSRHQITCQCRSVAKLLKVVGKGVQVTYFLDVSFPEQRKAEHGRRWEM